jgi:hypothetical protein
MRIGEGYLKHFVLHLISSQKTTKNGKTLTTVSFTTFSRALYNLIGEEFPKNPETEQRILCLRAMVGIKEPRGDYVVTLHSFSTFMKWYASVIVAMVNSS